jgi:SgrR family transcriptional regulator
MRLLDHYRRLHKLLQQREQQPGLPALALAMNCSERNMRNLLARMQEQGWLQWEPARGRGNLSRLTLLQSPQSASLEGLADLLAAGELEQAFGNLDKEQKNALAARLPEFLGVGDESGSSVRMPLFRRLESLDPVDMTIRLEAHFARQIFSRVVEMDFQSQQVVPGLAHHWESEDGGRTWHFWLRPGLRFHDGSMLEPEDVRLSLLRVSKHPGVYRRLYAHLQDIELGPQRRLTCRLAYADFLWPRRLTGAITSIVPRRRGSDFARLPIGSGPFKLTRNNEYRVTLRAFQDYYRERALLDEIDLWLLQPGAQAPRFDLEQGYPAELASTATTLEQAQSGCSYLACNPNSTWFGSADKRIALANWLAPQTMIGPEDAQRFPAYGLLPHWKHCVRAPGKRPPLPRGSSLTMICGQTQEASALAQMIRDRLAKAGVSLIIDIQPYVNLRQPKYHDKADFALLSEVFHDEDFGCFEWFSADYLFRRWMDADSRAALDAQLAKIQATPNSDKRRPSYQRIAKQLVEAAHMIPISHENFRVQAGSHLSGIQLDQQGQVPFANLWVRR